MGQLGISIYPEKSEFELDKAYLKIAKKYGFSRIFMNLLLFKPKDIEDILIKIRETVKYGNNLGFETYIDVNRYTMDALQIASDDLSYFSKLGVAGIRLDMGFTGKEEAEMTKNRFGLKIEINMSNDDHYLDRIFDYNPNRSLLVGCHNFFPQAYTGLSIDFFSYCSRRFLEKNIHTAAFVTSQKGKIGPWPLHEGLCTIESHRHLPIAAQVKHLKSLNLVDDIIIGNAYATEDELKEMRDAFVQDDLFLNIIPNNDLTAIEKQIITEKVHTYRGDRSEYMIRSSMPRFHYRDSVIPSKHDATPIKKGDVLILNDRYGQYKAEVQIALKDRPGDERVNKVGHISDEDLILVDSLRPYTDFYLCIQK